MGFEMLYILDASRGEIVDDANRISPGQERIRKMRADEAGPAGDQDFAPHGTFSSAEGAGRGCSGSERDCLGSEWGCSGSSESKRDCPGCSGNVRLSR